MWTWLESILQDVRYALRGFSRSPAQFWIAVMTMALGVGGVTAVFSVVDRILFRNLPYAHQDRLVLFGMKARINNSEFLLEEDFQRFLELRDRNRGGIVRMRNVGSNPDQFVL